MIGKYLSNVDSLIKKYFRKKRSLLVMILVGQALLIGLMTFFCLTRDSSDTIQVCGASQSMILVWDFFKNLMMVGFLMWIIGSVEDKAQEIKIISPQDLAVDDDATMKIFKTVLLLVLLVLVTILMILTLIGKSITKKSDETMLLMNTEGDWEYSPSKKRDAAVKF